MDRSVNRSYGLHRTILQPALAVIAGFFVVAGAALAQTDKKEYLTESEADQIRDAETNSERLKLFVSFAADRMQKFQYELNLKRSDRRRSEMLNELLNSYAGCIDDAADRLVVAMERQEDIREGLKEFKRKVPAFMEELKKLQANGPELATYKETLEDAIEATQEAMKDAEKAEKEIAPPPVRRKP